MDILCDTLRQLRKEKHLSMQAVADKLGVNKSTVKRWEDGTITNMGIDKIAALADIYGVSVKELLEFTEHNKPGVSLASEPMPFATDESIWKLREALRRSEGMRMLFDATKDATEEDLLRTVEIVNSLKRLSGKADD